MITTIQKGLLRIEAVLSSKRRSQPVFNVNRVANPRGMKRALFVYLTLPFHLRPGHPMFFQHQNRKQAVLIARLLGEFGYLVDVVDITDRSFRPAGVYDLILSHRVDCAGLETAINDKTVKIYLASGTNHLWRNRNIRQRLDALAARRGRALDPVVWDIEDMPWVRNADAVVCFGNEHVVQSWREVCPGPVYGFNNYGMVTNASFSRDYAEARHHFLFFGSGQQVGKGLDLLLEVFPRHPELHLYICSRYEREKDFCECYRHELFETPNIHPCGWIDIKGARFRQLVTRCAWVVHPTCSDASTGSVINAMSAGLVPIVTREAGIDLEDFGILFADDRLETIEQTICKAAQLPAREVEILSQRTHEAAKRDFSEEAFLRRWREILTDIHQNIPH
jgi:glycosyltransferase involved in cell wall biosynthesis